MTRYEHAYVMNFNRRAKSDALLFFIALLNGVACDVNNFLSDDEFNLVALVKELPNAHVFAHNINSYRAGLVLGAVGYNVNKQKLLNFKVENKLPHESIKPIKKTLELYADTYADFLKVVFSFVEYRNAKLLLKSDGRNLSPDLKKYFKDLEKNQALVTVVSIDDFIDYGLRNVC